MLRPHHFGRRDGLVLSLVSLDNLFQAVGKANGAFLPGQSAEGTMTDVLLGVVKINEQLLVLVRIDS